MKEKLGLYVLSQGGDLNGGVSVGEGEGAGVVGVGEELAAAEEAVAVGQLGVVLVASLLRRGFSGGGFRPLLDRVGESVVHLEAEDAVLLAAGAEREGERDDQEQQCELIERRRSEEEHCLCWGFKLLSRI